MNVSCAELCRYGLITFVGESVSSSSAEQAAKAAKREAKLIPELVFVIDKFESAVVKLSSNTETWSRMKHDIDLDAGTIISGDETIEECGRRVFEHVVAVAGGEPALAERTKHREFQIWSECSVSL